MTDFDRIVVLVVDSGGVGEMPDASEYGDSGSNTLANTARVVGGISVPNLGQMGLGCITDILGVPPVEAPIASYGRMAEASPGKDTTTGHWEMVGVILEEPLPLFPDGFSDEILDTFREKTGLDVLGNKAASGTEIIQELGEEHQRTGRPIVYTSADSVFQVAVHTDTIPLERLYEICELSRELLNPCGVARVIARPFTGTPGNYVRTKDRRDYALSPPGRTVLNHLTEEGIPVIGVGKIRDIFNGQGVTQSVHAKDNASIGEATIELLQKTRRGFIFSNFVDFDMLYGHRNDAQGYATALESFDQQLGVMLSLLGERDLLLLTADHGCDPTDLSTDHTREYVPILALAPRKKVGVDLGTRKTFADLGQTIAQAFGVEPIGQGVSFLKEVA